MTGELKEIAGQITAIDHERRTLAVTKKEGITIGLHWRQGLDTKMQKQKPRWFVKITYTIEDQDQNVVETCGYFEKPADWPQNGNQGGAVKGNGSGTRWGASDLPLMAS